MMVVINCGGGEEEEEEVEESVHSLMTTHVDVEWFTVNVLDLFKIFPADTTTVWLGTETEKTIVMTLSLSPSLPLFTFLLLSLPLSLPSFLPFSLPPSLPLFLPPFPTHISLPTRATSTAEEGEGKGATHASTFTYSIQ